MSVADARAEPAEHDGGEPERAGGGLWRRPGRSAAGLLDAGAGLPRPPDLAVPGALPQRDGHLPAPRRRRLRRAARRRSALPRPQLYDHGPRLDDHGGR